VTCAGFKGSETVRVTLDSTSGTLLGSFVAAGNGGGSLTFTLPAAKYGSHKLYAKGITSSRQATAALSVLASVTLNPASGTSGTTVTVNLTGFGGSESLSIRWYTTGSNYTTVKTGVKASASGSASTSFVVPANSTIGSHNVTVVRTGYGSVTTTFTVSATASLATATRTATPASTPTQTATRTPTTVAQSLEGAPTVVETVTPTVTPPAAPAEPQPWQVARITRTANGPEAAILLDGDASTAWVATDGRIASVTLDLDRELPVSAVAWLPGAGGISGTMRVQVSTDGLVWTDLMPGVTGADGWVSSQVGAPARLVRFVWIGTTPLGNVAEVRIYP